MFQLLLGRIDDLTERKIKSMRIRAKNESKARSIKDKIRIIMENRKRGLPKDFFH